MNDKNYFDDFKKSYGIKDKYYDLGSYTEVGKYGIPNYNYTNELYKYYKADKSAKNEETTQERDAHLLREKAHAREVKIDQILKK